MFMDNIRETGNGQGGGPSGQLPLNSNVVSKQHKKTIIALLRTNAIQNINLILLLSANPKITGSTNLCFLMHFSVSAICLYMRGDRSEVVCNPPLALAIMVRIPAGKTNPGHHGSGPRWETNPGHHGLDSCWENQSCHHGSDPCWESQSLYYSYSMVNWYWPALDAWNSNGLHLDFKQVYVVDSLFLRV